MPPRVPVSQAVRWPLPMRVLFLLLTSLAASLAAVASGCQTRAPAGAGVAGHHLPCRRPLPGPPRRRHGRHRRRRVAARSLRRSRLAAGPVRRVPRLRSPVLPRDAGRRRPLHPCVRVRPRRRRVQQRGSQAAPRAADGRRSAQAPRAARRVGARGPGRPRARWPRRAALRARLPELGGRHGPGGRADQGLPRALLRGRSPPMPSPR